MCAPSQVSPSRLQTCTYTQNLHCWIFCFLINRPSRSVGVDASLFDEGNHGPKVPQGAVELVLKASGRWPHASSELFVHGAGQLWRLWAVIIGPVLQGCFPDCPVPNLVYYICDG